MKNKSENYNQTVKRGLKWSTLGTIMLIVLTLLTAKFSSKAIIPVGIFEAIFFFCLAISTTLSIAKEEEELRQYLAKEKEYLRIYRDGEVNKAHEYKSYQDII